MTSTIRAGLFAVLVLAGLCGSESCRAQVLGGVGAVASGTGSGGVTYTLQDVWSDGAYNAFTDLTSYDGNFYLVFAASSGQSVPAINQPGKIRVLESANGQNWTQVALLSSSGDLRDPKISVTSGNQLMINAGDVSQTSPYLVQSAAWFSSSGTNWSNENPIGTSDYWIWRTVWHDGEGYGISYGPNNSDPTNGHEAATWLQTTRDGLIYTLPALQLSPTGQEADEAGLTFLPNGTAVMVTRRDLEQTSSVSVSTGNFTNWTSTNANLQIDSPDLLTLPDGRIVCAGRLYTSNTSSTAYTGLCWVDPKTGTLTPFLEFPYCTNGSSDTGYPGLVWSNNKLWVSYYSFTNNLPGADIFMAQVSIPNPSWVSAVSGSWSTASDWGGAAPGAIGAVVSINAPTNSPLTVTLDSPQTVGTLLLGNSASTSVGFTLSGRGSNSLTLSNSGSGATISVTGGAQMIDAPLVLADNLTVTGSGTLVLSSSSSIADTGGSHSLTMSGAGGTLILSGSDSYTGGTIVTAGTLIVRSTAGLPDGTSLTVGGGAQLLFDPAAMTRPSPTLFQGGQVVSPVPEPGTLALSIAGTLAGLCLWRRRKRCGAA